MTQVIVLNGGSSSGKSTIARALQDVLPGVWLTFGTDVLAEALPGRGDDPRSGLVLDSDTMLNSGMFVCSPARHAAFFRDVAERRFFARRRYLADFHQYEQAVLNYELQTAGLARLLPAAWNRLWPLHRPRVLPGAAARLERFRSFLAVREATFMLHLTGGQDHDFAFAIRNR